VDVLSEVLVPLGDGGTLPDAAPNTLEAEREIVPMIEVDIRDGWSYQYCDVGTTGSLLAV
jgi:hypothetical protein